jgi:hypothetical protein
MGKGRHIRSPFFTTVSEEETKVNQEKDLGRDMKKKKKNKGRRSRRRRREN